jgi:ribosomal-protein-alanine N-acetyltransferase
MGYAVRLMRVEDIPEVSEIDKEAFPTQWPPPSFRKDLNSRLTRYVVALEESNPYPSIEVSKYKAEGSLQRLVFKISHLLNKEHLSSDQGIAQNKHNILGYASIWLMVDEAHLTSIAVRGTHRRRGVGELLLISIVNLATQLNAQMVTLEVRASNLEAQALYEKYGFTRVGMRRSYYSDDGEDAVIMTTERITSAPYQARFQELKRNYIQRWGAIQGI